jgi:hypothetical protein
MSIFALVFSFSSQVCRASIITQVQRYNSSHTTPQLAGPLGEGSLSYVDRSKHRFYEIPSTLFDAEYVQAANDDKDISSYSIDITLAHSTTLYLFLDHRLGQGHTGSADTRFMDPSLTLAGMGWVLDMGFVDTGWDIAIDDYGDTGVDNFFSVFSKDVDAGTVRLFNQNDLTEVNQRNMYTVAVVPEPVSLTLMGLGVIVIIRRRRQPA